tara:strand:+ start:22767 stop:23204 length:438 start_codon:yes stop_codon:yes gene_type:complete
MYTKGQIEGILLTIANPEVIIFKSKASSSGYSFRLRVLFRATDINFLQALQRTLYQYMIKSNLKDMENNQRKLPVLVIGNRASLRRLYSLIPENVPKLHNWELFNRILTAMEEEMHLDEDGIIEMKEWYDDNKKRKTNNISGQLR